MSTHRGRILIAFAIVYLVWGSTYLGIRVAVETIPPFILAASRSLFAGAVLYAFARWRATRTGSTSGQARSLADDSRNNALVSPLRSRPSAAHWRTAFIMGFLMFVMGNALLSWAETRIDSGLAALIVGAIPLWVVVMARLNPYGAKREITLQKFVGVVVGIAGLGMLVWPGSATTAGVRMDPLAIGLLILGSLGWAWGTVISPSLAHSGDKLEGSAMTMLAGGAMILIPAALKGEFTQLHPELISARSIAAWVYLVVFGSMIAYSAYVYLVASCEASTVATYALVNPIVAVFLGWLFVGEVVTSRMVVATFVIVAGLALTLFGGEAAAWAGRRVRATGEAIRSVVL